ALDPQPAVLARLGAPVAERVAVGAIGGLLRGLVELALGEEKAFGPLEVLLAPRPALGAAFYPGHGSAPSWGRRSGPALPDGFDGLRKPYRLRRQATALLRNGFASGVEPARASFGRQAPVKHCLARNAPAVREQLAFKAGPKSVPAGNPNAGPPTARREASAGSWPCRPG